MTNDQARRELIFQAMEELLLEEGRESLTYAKISERCHLHTNTITYYFDGKEDMMVQFFQYVVDRDNANLPEFFTRVPDGMSPVEAFNTLIDYIIDGGHLESKTRRLLNLYLLPYKDISPKVRELLSNIHNTSCENEYEAIQMYNRLGIINKDKIREAIADITFSSSGHSLIQLFGVNCVDIDLALHSAKERIKKTLLKPEYYQETPYEHKKTDASN